MSKFPISWDEKSAYLSTIDAQQQNAIQLHEGRTGNVMCAGYVSCGNAEKALKEADVVVSGNFNTGIVEHAYIEPEAGFAEVRNGRLEIHACTQAPVMDLESLELILAMDRSNIRIMPTAVGGGFGSKLDLSVQPFLALAALKTQKPVRLCYTREESLQSSTKRHPSDINLTIGADNSGKIKGFLFEGVFDTGAYASWGPTVANRVPVHASGPYVVTDYKASTKGVYTNNPPSGAFRGFGVPQTAISQESLFDELAEILNIDPLEFRIKMRWTIIRLPSVVKSLKKGLELKPVWKRSGLPGILNVKRQVRSTQKVVQSNTVSAWRQAGMAVAIPHFQIHQLLNLGYFQMVESVFIRELLILDKVRTQ